MQGPSLYFGILIGGWRRSGGAPANLPPVAVGDTGAALQGETVTITVLANDSDPEGGPLDVIAATAVEGSVSIEPDNTLRYTAPLTFAGDDTVTYTIADPGGLTAQGTVTVAVSLAPNQPPVAVADTAAAAEGQTITIPVLVNDSDPEGGPLEVIAATAVEGSVTIAPDNTLSYTAPVGFLGPDTIVYTIADAGGLTASAPVTVTVSAAANQPPVAVGDTAAALQGETITIPVLANDSDPEGGLLDVIAASAVEGSVTIAADNTLDYTAPAGFSGDDTITYTIADPGGLTDTVTVTVTVSEAVLTANTEPDGTISLDAGTGTLTITVTAPPEYAGTYTVNTADLAAGPVALVAPEIVGTAAEGETLSARGGLWIYDNAAGLPSRSFQWLGNGADIPGATAGTYLVGAADRGTDLGLRETATDGFGSRSATAAPVTIEGFEPDTIAGLEGWWDASEAATLGLDGVNVTAWTDRSGNARTLTPVEAQPPVSATTAFPERLPGALNGRDIVRLDWDAGYVALAMPDIPALGGSAPRSVFAVVRGSVDRSVFLSLCGPTSANYERWTLRNDAGALRIEIQGGGTTTGLVLAAAGNVIGAINAGTSLDDHTAYLDGAAAALSGTATLATGTVDSYIGRKRAGDANGGAAEFAEILVYSAALAASDREKVEGYLAHKWGLAGNLPTGHPYRTEAP